MITLADLRVRAMRALAGAALVVASALPAVAGGGGLPGLYTITDVDGKPVPAAAKLTIRFSEKASFEGFGGCNHFSGPYKFVGPITAQSVIMGPIRVTKKSCPEDVMSLEHALLRALGTAHTIERADDGAFVIADDKGKTTARLVFKAAD
ncbi:META domain-containing protein [Segnochrobactrum spirostomi]|uniref:META domain-containing protein n=1 Tax=Segnochrobactrum spirostomi TaxID=2608987 RepID=A0A6A7XYY4_9HYPH|nr:META domain-containing protein [Segnochrobactrum spirostomi]MQT11327.1 META domain-containing protein [Segnochrobactrum spirostomi]